MVLLATSQPTLACTLRLTVDQALLQRPLPQLEVLGWPEPLLHLEVDGEALEDKGGMVVMAAMVDMATADSGEAVGEDEASGAGGGARMAISGVAAKVRARVTVDSSRASSKERVRITSNNRVRVNSNNRVRLNSNSRIRSHKSRMEVAVTKTMSVLGQAQPLAPAHSWTWNTMDQTHSRLLKRHNRWLRRSPSKHTVLHPRWPLNMLPT